MNESLGDRIRTAREQRGLSQAELSRRIQISRNAMCKIERGTIPDPRASRIKAIAEVLGVTTDALLGCRLPPARRAPPPHTAASCGAGPPPGA